MESDVGTYYCEWNADKQNGNGRLEFKNGDVYEGEFKSGSKDGFGILTCANKDQYEGSWKEDKKCGKGKQTWNSGDRKGDVYEGQFGNDVFNGNGHYKYANGDWYEGQFLQGAQCGQSVQKYLDGDSIEIRSSKVKSNYDAISSTLKEFIEEITQQIEQNNVNPLKVINLKDFLEIVEIILYNIQKYPNITSIKNDIIQLKENFATKVIDNKTFTGQFGSNSIYEYRKCTMPSGEEQIGPFNSQNQLCGWGKIAYSADHERLSYEGEFQNGKYCGFGIRKLKNGKVNNSFRWFNLPNGMGKAKIQVGPNQFVTYEGGVLDNEYNGFGKYTYADGSWYEGEWKDGKKNGKGKDVMANGNSYEGVFVDGKYCGHGKYTWSYGSKYTWKSGQIDEGEFKDNILNGEGKRTYTDGSIYTGQFKNDKRYGQGKLVKQNGGIVEGEWENDELK